VSVYFYLIKSPMLVVSAAQVLSLLLPKADIRSQHNMGCSALERMAAHDMLCLLTTRNSYQRQLANTRKHSRGVLACQHQQSPFTGPAHILQTHYALNPTLQSRTNNPAERVGQLIAAVRIDGINCCWMPAVTQPNCRFHAPQHTLWPRESSGMSHRACSHVPHSTCPQSRSHNLRLNTTTPHVHNMP
jgi:hypothetical protein